MNKPIYEIISETDVTETTKQIKLAVERYAEINYELTDIQFSTCPAVIGHSEMKYSMEYPSESSAVWYSVLLTFSYNPHMIH